MKSSLFIICKKVSLLIRIYMLHNGSLTDAMVSLLPVFKVLVLQFLKVVYHFWGVTGYLRSLIAIFDHLEMHPLLFWLYAVEILIRVLVYFEPLILFMYGFNFLYLWLLVGHRWSIGPQMGIWGGFNLRL